MLNASVSEAQGKIAFLRLVHPVWMCPFRSFFGVFVKEGCRAPYCPPMHTIQHS